MIMNVIENTCRGMEERQLLKLKLKLELKLELLN
jgi:hypothetical protein